MNTKIKLIEIIIHYLVVFSPFFSNPFFFAINNFLTTTLTTTTTTTITIIAIIFIVVDNSVITKKIEFSTTKKRGDFGVGVSSVLKSSLRCYENYNIVFASFFAKNSNRVFTNSVEFQ